MHELAKLELELVFLTASMLILKTFLFFKTITRKSFKNWIRFDHNTLLDSKNKKQLKAKILQNTLSLFCGLLIFLECIIIVINKS